MSKEPNPSSSSSSPLRVRVSEMESPQPPAEEEAAAAAVWEWGSLLDFPIDDNDPLFLSWASGSDLTQIPSPPPPPSADPDPTDPPAADPASSNRVRKRDPRLVCENYLAGRVPCSCPEVDEKELEEEDAAEAVAVGRKRARAGGAPVAVRCQVPGCEADIRELKGYHRRHRVCLRCANASSVVLDGEVKRYCQQCGK